MQKRFKPQRIFVVVHKSNEQNEVTTIVHYVNKRVWCLFADIAKWENRVDSDVVIPSTCQQVFMYNASRNDYLEIRTYYSPFCGLIWCGLDVSTAQALKASTWTCLNLT